MHVNYLGFNSGNYGVWSLCKWLILCVRPSIWSWGLFAVTGLSRPPGYQPNLVRILHRTKPLRLWSGPW